MGIDLSQYRSTIGTYLLNMKIGPRAKGRKRKRAMEEEKEERNSRNHLRQETGNIWGRH